MICRMSMVQRDALLFYIDALTDYKIKPSKENTNTLRIAKDEFSVAFKNENQKEDAYNHVSGT